MFTSPVAKNLIQPSGECDSNGDVLQIGHGVLVAVGKEMMLAAHKAGFTFAVEFVQDSFIAAIDGRGMLFRVIAAGEFGQQRRWLLPAETGRDSHGLLYRPDTNESVRQRRTRFLHVDH
jgi:hypothetical protein